MHCDKEEGFGGKEVMSEVMFDEATHTYTLDGRKLISVTQLLQKVGISPDYSLVDEKTLKESADRGSMIHGEIEAYNKTMEIGFTDECQEYIAWLHTTKSKCLKSEFEVHNDYVAGRADLLLEENGKKVIADIKTTSALHKDSVSWQLSLYAYLLGDKEVKKGQAFWFSKDGLKVVKIPLKPVAEVERLLKSVETDSEEMFAETVPVSDDQISALEEAELLIKQYDKAKKEMQKRSEALKEAIIKSMEKQGVYSFNNGRIKVSYIAPTIRKSIDTAKLKEEMPDIAEKYTKSAPVKAGVRITVREQNDD